MPNLSPNGWFMMEGTLARQWLTRSLAVHRPLPDTQVARVLVVRQSVRVRFIYGAFVVPNDLFEV